MSDSNRPISRWSTSMSIATKSTSATHQTAPFTNVRKKLLRQSAHCQNTLAQRMAKSKHDIEELFKLYYSNDIKFDTFHRQIVTGTRISTARTNPLPQSNPTTNSTNVFNSKHCVSREQLSTLDSDYNEQQQPIARKQSSTNRSVQIRLDNNSTTNPSIPTSNPSLSPPTIIPKIRNLHEISSSNQHDELYDSSLVKSVAFLGDNFNEFHDNINKTKSNINQRSKSSLLSILPDPPPPSLLVMNNNNQKDPATSSHTSFSTITSLQQQQQQNRPTIVTGSAVIVRQRSPTKQSWNKQRTKSNLSMTANSSLHQSSTKTRSPSICSPLSIQGDMPELPVFVGTPRVVSIPSKCSRYVLVTFPEVPLRYNAPSYVERLLLPERFPTLFQNIVQSYDAHLSTNNQNSK